MVSEQVDAVLEVLAERFGTTVGMLWEVMLRQQVVHGVGYAIGAIMCLAVLIVCIVVFKRSYGDRESLADVLSGLVGILAAGLLIPLTINAIGRFYNPVYYAIEMILSSFK
jgi:hypothetical protein